MPQGAWGLAPPDVGGHLCAAHVRLGSQPHVTQPPPTGLDVLNRGRHAMQHPPIGGSNNFGSGSSPLHPSFIPLGYSTPRSPRNQATVCFWKPLRRLQPASSRPPMMSPTQPTPHATPEPGPHKVRIVGKKPMDLARTSQKHLPV